MEWLASAVTYREMPPRNTCWLLVEDQSGPREQRDGETVGEVGIEPGNDSGELGGDRLGIIMRQRGVDKRYITHVRLCPLISQLGAALFDYRLLEVPHPGREPVLLITSKVQYRQGIRRCVCVGGGDQHLWK